MDLCRDPETEVERIRACCQDVGASDDEVVIDLVDEGVIDLAGAVGGAAGVGRNGPGEPEPVPAGRADSGRSAGHLAGPGRDRPGRDGPDRGGQEEPVLPEQTRDDTDRGWGEDPPEDDDERLLRERPPHWQ